MASGLFLTRFGNFFYHFFGNLGYIEDSGFWKALAESQGYIFYTVMRAGGIGISQLREGRVETTGWIRGRLVPAFCVTVFFSS